MNNSVSWTTEELQVWTNAGLIPKDLLDPQRIIELIDYVATNKEKLFSYYRKKDDETDAYITLPKPDELPVAYELQMRDKKTGRVIDVLHKTHKFELYEGIFLTIREQELASWEKDTASVHELTKEQGEDFKETILKVASKGVISREEIVTVIEEVRKKRKSGKVRRGGHFTDSKLNHEYNAQKTGLRAVSPETRSIMPTTIKTFGIKLTPSEDKLIGAIYNLLHKKSENKNVNSESFYMGNIAGQLVAYGNSEHKSMSAGLICKPAELYKEYLGKDTYSGKDIQNIKNLLSGISNKKFLIQYDRQRIIKKGKKTETVTDRIEAYQSLIIIMSYYDGMTDKEVQSIDSGNQIIREQKEELILGLNPLLTDQINSKYVEYPMDINQRTMIASGGAMRVTESIIDLRDYMLREISAKRYKCSLNEYTIIGQLRLISAAKSGRKKLVATKIKNAIEACKNLGLIVSVKIEAGAQGQTKYTFELNADFE